MVIGGVLGIADIGLIMIEIGIVLSVIFLGFTIASNSKLNLIVVYTFVAIFAIFHGYAHSQEIPELAIFVSYISGFMIGTASLHIFGLSIGYLAKKVPNGETLLRYSGAVIIGIEFHIIIQIASLLWL